MIRIYSVTMQTPFGTKQGRITFIINGEHLTGVLEGMGSESKFVDGKIYENNFEFSGEIKTLLVRIQYTAKGILSDNLLSASVSTNYGIFSVSGNLISQA